LVPSIYAFIYCKGWISKEHNRLMITYIAAISLDTLRPICSSSLIAHGMKNYR
jgi:hypothetical protein